MLTSRSLGFSLLLVVVCHIACGDAFHHLQHLRFPAFLQKYFDHKIAKDGPSMDPPPYQWFTQKLDHFDEQDRRTFKQRYVVNDKFFNGTGPVFMMINGEGPMSQATVTELQFVQWAEKLGALIVSLEHRYYGASYATPDMSTENMKYLSSQQALADNAAFRQAMAQRYNALANPWIVFGGSYSGALSAWFKIKYPHLAFASVASSAPVHAEVDFKQYLEVVQNSLATFNPGCVKNVAAATDAIQSMLSTTSGQQKLQNMFESCGTINNPPNIATFMSNLAGNIMGSVQYNAERFTNTTVNIPQICGLMDGNGEPLSSYASLAALYNTDSKTTCTDNSYGDMINQMKNITNTPNAIGGRQWFYQTCIEFGFYQSSDSSNQPFGNLFPIQYWTQQCKDVFGFDFLPNANWTNTFYGGRHPEGENILFVNGSIDPWHALGVLSDVSDTQKALFIQGTAHCADMLVANAQSPPTLKVAQDKIFAQIKAWVASAQQPK